MGIRRLAEKILLVTLFLIFSLFTTSLIAQAALSEGDLAIVGVNFDTNEVAVVALTDISAGETVLITDRGWDDSTDTFTTGASSLEGTITWTTPSMSAGDIITFQISAASTISATITGGGSTGTHTTTEWTLLTLPAAHGFSDTGESIIIYQGSAPNPNFIFAFNGIDGAGPCSGNTAVAANMWCPAVDTLNLFGSTEPESGGTPIGSTAQVNLSGTDAVGEHQDNNVYNGPTSSADQATWLTRISTEANWNQDNTTPFSLDPTDAGNDLGGSGGFDVAINITVDGTGTGNGNTTGTAPSTIDCDSDAGVDTGTCTEAVSDPTVVELTATADAGSVFTDWSGCDAPAGNVCTQTVSGGSETVQPNFELERTLTVDGTGGGNGNTTGTAPSTINCDSDAGVDTGTCNETVADGTVVELTATADPGSIFTGWSGCDSAAANVCTQTVAGGNETVQPNFEIARTLTVDGTGTGNGNTTGTAPSSINCDSDAGVDTGTCNETVSDGTVVELTATADAGSVFTSWSGCDSAAANVCTQTVAGGNETVQPNFELERTLTVDGTGTGNGNTTRTAPSSINCDSDAGVDTGTCNETVTDGTVVELTATADPGSIFTGWSGCDSAAANVCTQTVAGGNETVQPNFELERTLTVDGTGTGNGNTTGTAPSSINCDSDAGVDTGTCSEQVSDGTVVELTATADAGSVFTGWSGCDSAAANVCTQTVAGGNETVQPNFEIQRTLTITGSGTGNGTVIGTGPSTINCTITSGATSGTCAEQVANGTMVELTATATVGVFGGWTDCDSEAATVCTQTVSGGNETVDAAFDAPDLVITKENNAPGGQAESGTPFTWTLTVTNNGTADAEFATNDMVLADMLPAGATYGAPQFQAVSGITGTLTCQIVLNELTCAVTTGTFTIAPGGSFTVTIEVTPTISTGTLTNPDGGSCEVDPDDVVTESNEGNNACNVDSVIVTPPFDITAPQTFRVTSSFNVPVWCGTNKEEFSMNGNDFVNLEQIDTEIEIVLPQKRILGLIPFGNNTANILELFTLIEPSNFQTPGSMTLPIKAELNQGKTIRITCDNLIGLPTNLDGGGEIDQFLSQILSDVDFFHGVLTISSDNNDLKVYANKIVRRWSGVDEGGGIQFTKGKQTRERIEIERVRVSDQITTTIEVNNQVNPLNVAASDDQHKLKERVLSVQALRAAGGSRIEFRAQNMNTTHMQVEIYGLNGKLVHNSGEVRGNRLSWNLVDMQNRPVANGVYLYVVTIRGGDGVTLVHSEVKKLLVLR